MNSATHERFTIVHEHPVAESAGDEHAAAGGLTTARHHRHDLHGQVKNLPPRGNSTYRAEHYWDGSDFSLAPEENPNLTVGDRKGDP